MMLSTVLAIAATVGCQRSHQDLPSSPATPPSNESTKNPVNQETQEQFQTTIFSTPTKEDPKKSLKRKIDRVFGCNLGDDEQTVSDEALKNKLTVTDRIESKTVEKVSCLGKVRKVIRPLQAFFKIIDLEPPFALPSKVVEIRIENQKTCSSLNPELVTGEPLSESFDGSRARSWLGRGRSLFDPSGKIKLVISDNILFTNTELPVRDGLNVLRIRYFGECLKKNEKDECVQNTELAAKDIALELKVDRPLGSIVEQRLDSDKPCLPVPPR